MHNLAHVARWDPHNRHDLDLGTFSGLDLYCAGPAQPLTTADEEVDDLDRDLSDLSVLSDLSDLSEVWNSFDTRATQ